MPSLTSTLQPLVRLARCGVLGAAVVLAAGSAHVAGGGTLQAGPLLAIVVGASALALVLPRPTVGQLLGLLLLGQAAVHLGGGTGSGGLGMLVAHLVSTVLTLLLARRADRWWAELADRLVERVRGPQVVRVPATTGVPVVTAPLRRSGVAFAAVVDGRGPPQVA